MADNTKEVLDQMVTKFNSLETRTKTLNDKKIRAEERLKSAKEQLELTIQEIKSLGYNPQDLSSIIETKTSEMKEALVEYESKLNEAETLLNSISGL